MDQLAVTPADVDDAAVGLFGAPAVILSGGNISAERFAAVLGG